jgi:probable phosphoglycerate mutase
VQELYLCRHGETEWTLSGRHTGKTDIHLTEKGRLQAAFLRKQIKDTHFDQIFTSPLLRAKETCEGLKAIVDPHIVEWDYGQYEGFTSDEIHKKNPSWNLFSDGALGGETVQQVGKRADLFLKTGRSFQGKVAVFSHGHFLRVLAARFLGLGPEMGEIFFLSVASISILGFEGGKPVVTLWNAHF